MSMMSIPVVDISHWSGVEEDGLVQKIHDAFTTVGIIGHGIPRERVSYHIRDVNDVNGSDCGSQSVMHIELGFTSQLYFVLDTVT